MSKTIEQINAMPASEFADAFGEVVEHSRWVSASASGARPYADRDAMISAFCDVLLAADGGRQLAVLRAHPDLAGKAAVAGELTEDSREEQAGAGLSSLSHDEFERFTDLNGRYQERFGFPFIFAVKGATKDQILEAFEARILNGLQAEFDTAIQQVCRIIRFRLEDRVAV